LEVTLTVRVTVPRNPAVFTVAWRSTDSSGASSRLANAVVVHPHDVYTSEIVSVSSPAFLNTNVWVTSEFDCRVTE